MSEPLPKPNRWFNYPIRVQPHHTDYGGVVWHGSYITWMESARVECLRAAGLSFEQFVQLGYDLPVVALDIRYRQPLRLGVEAMVKTQLEPVKGVRLNWHYKIESIEPVPQLCVSGQVSLVTVNVRDRKIVRRLPAEIMTVIAQIEGYFQQLEA